MAVVAINIGGVQLWAVLWIPEIPFRAVAVAMKWATDRMGPTAWVILGVVVAGGVYWYIKQPLERRERIKTVAAKISTAFMNEYAKASTTTHQARLQLRACMVPKPEQRTPLSAIMRELALSPESLSAAQPAELLEPTLRPPVADIRSFLRAYDRTMFNQVRRGGFVLGAHYELPG